MRAKKSSNNMMMTPLSGLTERGMGAMIHFKKKLQLESLHNSLSSKDTKNSPREGIKMIASERILKSRDVLKPGIFQRKSGFGKIDQ